MDPGNGRDPSAYVGLPLVDALARAGLDGWTPRVLHESSIVTMEHRPGRLNLVIADDADEATAVVIEARQG